MCCVRCFAPSSKCHDLSKWVCWLCHVNVKTQISCDSNDGNETKYPYTPRTSVANRQCIVYSTIGQTTCSCEINLVDRRKIPPGTYTKRSQKHRGDTPNISEHVWHFAFGKSFVTDPVWWLLSVCQCIFLSVSFFFHFHFILRKKQRSRTRMRKWEENEKKGTLPHPVALPKTMKNLKMTFLLQCNRVSRQCARVLINKVKQVKWLLAISQVAAAGAATVVVGYIPAPTLPSTPSEWMRVQSAMYGVSIGS